jgi:hypothetical protein
VCSSGWQSSYPLHNMTSSRLWLTDRTVRTQKSIVASPLPSFARLPPLVVGRIPPFEDGFINIPFHSF